MELVATVAEALHHAHRQGLIHRDIKPGNILLDQSGRPFVADFGLALREQDVGKETRYAQDACLYVAPNRPAAKAIGSMAHSTMFLASAWCFYELLVGKRPFKADAVEELLEQITTFEPRPPRQVDDRIPKELERICLKALTKRAAGIYDGERHGRRPAAFPAATGQHR